DSSSIPSSQKFVHSRYRNWPCPHFGHGPSIMSKSSIGQKLSFNWSRRQLRPYFLFSICLGKSYLRWHAWHSARSRSSETSALLLSWSRWAIVSTTLVPFAFTV